jgi:hypothetical protein
MPLELDTGRDHLEMFFKDWQVEALRYLWSVRPGDANSRAVWENVNLSLQGSISRASVINFLNAMVDEGLLTYTERTGKGGHQRLYTIAFDEQEFKTHVVGLMIGKLIEEFPQETRKILQVM